MTKAELSQLRNLRQEISELEKRLVSVHDLLADTEQLTDCVQGSMDVLPYAKHSIIISDFSDTKAAETIYHQQCAIEREITRKLGESVTEYGKLLSYINGLQDSYIRRIMRYRYLDGYNWTKIAMLIGGGNTADGVRKAHDRFLEKEELSVLSAKMC